MQEHDWNDLRYLLALHRTGKLTKAGRAVGMSETTVARRIRIFERALGLTLFVRTGTGRYEATETCLKIIDHAEAVEREMVAILERVGLITDRAMGVVRISSVPIIVNRMLVPNLIGLGQEHPGLTIELVPDSSNLDLTKREVDLAVRFSRPTTGGLKTKALRLGALEFGVYAPRSASPDDMGALSWISYDDAHTGLPQAQWLEAILARTGATRVPLRVSDAETALEAVACGLGKTILPKSVADADQRLHALPIRMAASPPTRDVWLLSHVDQSARSSVSAVKDWLVGLFRNCSH